MRPFFQRLPLFLLVASLLIAASSCGHRPRGDKNSRTLSQISDNLPDDGYYLCRHDFSVSYNSHGGTFKEFKVAAGNGRTQQKKKILNQCFQESDASYKRACMNQENIKKMNCIHETLIAPVFTAEPNRKMECKLEFTYRYADQVIGGFSETIESSSAVNDLLQHTRSVIDQCLRLQGVAREGCTTALLGGSLKCKQI